VRLLLAQQALEARRSEKRRRHSVEGTSAPSSELLQRGIECATARASGGERGGELLAVVDEALLGEGFDSSDLLGPKGRTAGSATDVVSANGKAC